MPSHSAITFLPRLYAEDSKILRKKRKDTGFEVPQYSSRISAYKLPQKTGGKTGIPIMEVYKRESQKILQRFFDGQIGGAECIAALDTAIRSLIARMDPTDLTVLKELMLRNHELVNEEGWRRARNTCNGKEVCS
jgi:hypothetical protein